MLTDGVDTGSKVSLGDAIEAAQRSDTLVYSILFADPNANYGNYGGLGGPRRGRRRGGGTPFPPRGSANRPDGKKVLEQISRGIGGRFFEISHKQPIEKAYTEIKEDLRNQYSIGYTPEKAERGVYRHIHLATKNKGLTVQAREGYYAS